MQLEQLVTDHDSYMETYRTVADWIRLTENRLQTYKDLTGDRHSVINRLERVQDLLRSTANGGIKLNACDECASIALKSTGITGSQTIQRELESLRHGWDQCIVDITDSESRLKALAGRWKAYEDSCEKVGSWMKELEKTAKSNTGLSTLDEKKLLVKKYQVKFSVPVQHTSFEIENFYLVVE